MSVYEQVGGWLAAAKSAVAFTGAGISTESGIPDFRSPGGVWATSTPVYYDEFLASDTARHEYWRQKCEGHQQFRDAQPNAGHNVLAGWEERRRLRGVITQNIDELHQIAGSQNVLQLHGAGVATGLISIPNRYMHSAVECVSLADLDHVAQLLAEVAVALTEDDDFTPSL